MPGIDSHPSNRQPSASSWKDMWNNFTHFHHPHLVRSPLFMVALAETIVLALFPSARSKTTTPSTTFFTRMQTYYHFSQDIQMLLHCTVATLSQCSLMATLHSGMSWCTKEKLLPLSIGNVPGGALTIGSIPRPNITQMAHHSSGLILWGEQQVNMTSI